MNKIKVVSNPYEKTVTFCRYDLSSESWITINSENNSNSKLVSAVFQRGFFPFKVYDILKEIENELKRTGNLDKERNMFVLQTRTFFNNGSNLGHAVIFMNRNKHASKFEVIFKVDGNDGWNFYYENNVCLDNNERVDFEKWFKTTV